MNTEQNDWKVINVKKAKGDKEDMWKFTLYHAGCFINGFVYNNKTGAIFPPTWVLGKKRIPVVKGAKWFWPRLRTILEEEIINAAGKERETNSRITEKIRV